VSPYEAKGPGSPGDGPNGPGKGDAGKSRMRIEEPQALLPGADAATCIAHIIRHEPAWLHAHTPESDVVVSSRVRLARNLAGFPFTHQASGHERQHICDLVRNVIAEGERPMQWIDMRSIGPLDRSLLAERNLISRQLAMGRAGAKKRVTPDEPRAVAVALPGERIGVMINEEDHLRIQAIRPGLDLVGAHRDVDETDDRIESRLDYAFSPRFGYLTACPTNVGTGIRYSVMLHLPGLRHTGEIEKVKRAAEDMSLAVRGIFGEGTESSGDLYQISNQTTLGKSEKVLLAELAREILPRVIAYERLAREQLLERQREMLEDKVHRAIGLLASARLMAADEALGLLSSVRLGACVGLIRSISPMDVARLMLNVQPAHLQRITGSEMNQARRRAARADFLRKALAPCQTA